MANDISNMGDSASELQMDDFINQPNINMVIPWIYNIVKSLSGGQESMTSRENNILTTRDGQQVDLNCFLNQPNINMTIPWIYQICNMVQRGSNANWGLEIEDLTQQGGYIDEQ